MGMWAMRMIVKRHMSKLSSPPPSDTTPLSLYLRCLNDTSPSLSSSPDLSKVTDICRVLASNPKNLQRASSLLNSLAVSPTEPLVAAVLKRLSNSTNLALSFFAWAQTQSGFTHTAEAFHILIDSAGKTKNFKKVWELIDEMRSHDLLSRNAFHIVLRRYARSKMPEEVVQTLEKMDSAYGFKLELSDYNKLLDVLAKSRKVAKAHRVLDEMRKRQIEPDIRSYTALLEGWSHTLKLDKIDEVLKMIKKSGLKMDVVAYGIVTHAYCKKRKHKAAIKIFGEMEALGIKPNPIIFCTMIIGLGSAGRLKEALEFFHRATLECPPEVDTYNALVGAYCWADKTEEALCVADRMRALGIGPNARTYDIIIHRLIMAEKNDQALELFKKIRDGPDPAGPYVYKAVGRMLCDEGRLREAEEIVWGPMRTRGIFPTMHMFWTMINAMCRANDIDGACRFYEDMIAMGIRPTPVIIRVLETLLLSNGKEDTVNALNKKLQRLLNSP